MRVKVLPRAWPGPAAASTDAAGTDATHEANLICEKTLLNTTKRRGRAEAQAHPQKDRQDR